MCCSQALLDGKGAELMQAVPNMLELVPRGVNKWVGLQVLHCCIHDLPFYPLTPDLGPAYRSLLP